MKTKPQPKPATAHTPGLTDIAAARLIVRAVNSHADLLAACENGAAELEMCAAALEGSLAGTMGRDTDRAKSRIVFTRETIAALRAAIAKAGGRA